MGTGRMKLIVAGAIIVAGVSYLMITGISETTVYYFKLSELMADPSSHPGGVRINGHVVPGSIQHEAKTMTVNFVMTEGDVQIPVTYSGIVPDTFKDESEVVVEGVLSSDRSAFKAHTLLAKCPSKYESQANTEIGREHQKKYGIQSDMRGVAR